MTAVWGNPEDKPSINLVAVTNDDAMQDAYGRQIVRATSIVHLDNQAAGANCWLMPDDARCIQWDGVRHIMAAGKEHAVARA